MTLALLYLRLNVNIFACLNCLEVKYVNLFFLRMLGGASLGIHMNSPKVIARIFPEKDERLKIGLDVCLFNIIYLERPMFSNGNRMLII